MTTITVRNVGAYGFNTTPLNGIGLSTAEAAITRSDVDQALALADALRAAMQAAREAGLQAFAPAQAVAAGLLSLPAGPAPAAVLTTANRDDFFANKMGRAYAGGAVSLEQWSHAVEELEHWAGANASRLPPGAGGGTRNVRGTWYVNGEPWSLSELFTVNRVNTLSEIDRMVADSLNVIAANNEAAKSLTGLMKLMFDRYRTMNWGSGSVSYRIGDKWVDAFGQFTQAPALLTQAYQGNSFQRPDSLNVGPTGWTQTTLFANVSTSTGVSTQYITGPFTTYPPTAPFPASELLDHPISYDKLLQYADKYIGPGSLINKLKPNGLGQEDFRAMIDEVEQILGAFSADNQVAQLRNETLFNSRSNLLEGLGTFLKGQQTTRSTLARNA